MTEHKGKLDILPYLNVAVILLLAVSTAVLVYFHFEMKTQIAALTTEKEALVRDGASAKQILTETEERLLAVSTELELTEEELDELEDDYRKERKKNDEFEDQIKKITGTVNDLDRLSKTDEELLQKYSKVYFLNENYVPSDLDKINDRYVLNGKGDQYFHGDAMKFLEKMMDEARDDDIDLHIVSAYRSFDSQTELKGQYTQTYGTGANTFSADQGYSEHQLGTTLDLTTTDVGGAYASFAETEAYEWLLDHAHKYGFTLSYPEDNSFYIFEPWHWRFVGEELSRDLHRDNDHFYDLDQREIDAYLINIFN